MPSNEHPEYIRTINEAQTDEATSEATDSANSSDESNLAVEMLTSNYAGNPTTFWKCPCGASNYASALSCKCGINYGSAIYYMAKTEQNTSTIKNIALFWLVLSILGLICGLLPALMKL
jgi:hypothetical protein